MRNPDVLIALMVFSALIALLGVGVADCHNQRECRMRCTRPADECLKVCR